MKHISILFLVFALISCGKKDPQKVTEYVNVPGEVVEILPPDATTQELVDELVEQENDYRDSLGQVPLTEGLTCSVYNAANGDLDVSFGSVAYTFSFHGEFDQAEIGGSQASGLLPEYVRNLYIGMNYSLRCQGQIIILESGRHEFTLNSDDGSRLWVNGTMIIDNEGTHGMVSKMGTIVLRRGIYSFRLDYSQSGGGNQGLLLTSGGELLNHLYLYR